MSRFHTKERVAGEGRDGAQGPHSAGSGAERRTDSDLDAVPVDEIMEVSSRKVLDTSKVDTIIDGRYRITGLVGRGGMGSVYRAEHVKIRRTVAMKLLHPTLAKIPEVSQRFEREAFAIGRIEHPNCVNVSDFGQLEDGSLYLVMEYLEGRALGDVLAKERRLDPVRTMHIVRHVLRGLGHAHEHGIVHRDVKPENVLLIAQDSDPEFAKILDFGIAKLMGRAVTEGGGSKLTQAGVAFGTPIYMSPEQAVGNPVDGRADLYAASVMAYEMIAGKPPFDSDDKLEVMSMHTSKPVPLFAVIAPDVAVPPEIERIIMRGLAKRPEERYADALEYIGAIDRAIGHPYGPATPGEGNAAMGDPHGMRMTPMPAMIAAGQDGSQGYALPAPRTGATSTVTVLYPHATPPGTLPVVAAPPRRRRGWLLALALVVGGAGLAFAMTRKSEDKPPPREVPLAVQAEELLKRGDPKDAIKLLEGAGDLIAQEPSAQLQLGHAYAFTNSERKALAVYRTAIGLDPALIADSVMRSNFEVMLGDKKQDIVAVEAADLVLTVFGESDALRPRAADRLVEIASKAKSNDARIRARDLAEKHGLGDRVDLVASFVRDLIYGKNCEERAKAIPKLRALGDPRAIEALQAAPARKGRYGRAKGRPINTCMKEAAAEAVQYLQSLAAAVQSDAGIEIPDDDGNGEGNEETDGEP